MKKITKAVIFFAVAAANIIFFLLCDYGKVQIPDTASYLDPFLGTVAIVVLAFGGTSLGIQLYFRSKYKALKIRSFDIKFWRQCIAILFYYAGSLVFLAVSHSVYKAGYLSVFALILCPLWMIGSRTLWMGENGEESYYLDDLAKWYVVSSVTENDEVVEIKCKAPDDRERTISIAKKKRELEQ